MHWDSSLSSLVSAVFRLQTNLTQIRWLYKCDFSSFFKGWLLTPFLTSVQKRFGSVQTGPHNWPIWQMATAMTSDLIHCPSIVLCATSHHSNSDTCNNTGPETWLKWSHLCTDSKANGFPPLTRNCCFLLLSALLCCSSTPPMARSGLDHWGFLHHVLTPWTVCMFGVVLTEMQLSKNVSFKTTSWGLS